jgi:hypothetical protein
MSDLTYIQIRRVNFDQVEREWPTSNPDNTSVAERAHAIAMKRLSNCPGFWQSEEDEAEATRLIIKDIEQDAADHGWKGKLEDWATKKLIELAVKILISYLETHYKEKYNLPGITGAADNFGTDMRTWGTQAEQSLSE